MWASMVIARMARSTPVRFPKFVQHGFARFEALIESFWVLLIDGANIGQAHDNAGHSEMRGRVNETWKDHFVFEAVVHFIGLQVQRRAHTLQGSTDTMRP